MSTKKRGQNFSTNEKEILIQLISKHKDVVENKKTDAVSSALKRKGWEQLTDEFNSISSSCFRNTDQLRTCWENIKRFTRKYKACTKKQMNVSGGERINIPSPGPFLGQVEMILGPSLEGLDNPYDSDVQFTDQGLSNFSITIKGESQNENADEYELIDDEISELADEHMPPEKAEKQDLNSSTPSRTAALKTKVSNTISVDPLLTEDVVDTLVRQENRKRLDTKLVRRRRLKTSLQDKVLQNKLELIEIMKQNAKTDGKIKEEQLQQEKIKTELLRRELERTKSSSA